MNLAKWDQRIRRAEELTATHPFAADVLRFYQRVATAQTGLYWYLKESSAVHVASLLPKLPEFLLEIESNGPEPIAECAREWKARTPDQSCELLGSYWQSSAAASDPQALVASLFLQPYAEHLAEQAEIGYGQEIPATCPFCSRKPAVGVLRPEGDGAKRSLICSMCSTEWPCGRILCPACGEQNSGKLAVYSADEFAHVRVEACDSCGCYIKTVDLSKNGRAVPIVDELATIPLNLWAQQQGYVKMQTNLLGI